VSAPCGLAWPWLAMAVASLAVPWVLYPLGGSGARVDALAPGELWAGLWPVLLGGFLALGIWRSGYRLPRIPQGDIVVAGETAARVAAAWSRAIERADYWLRRWQVACLSLLAVAVLLGLAMTAWR
jgi:hypothetical protein